MPSVKLKHIAKKFSVMLTSIFFYIKNIFDILILFGVRFI